MKENSLIVLVNYLYNEGKSTKYIADKLEISTKKVRSYVNQYRNAKNENTKLLVDKILTNLNIF